MTRTIYRVDKKTGELVAYDTTGAGKMPLEMTFMPKMKDGVKSPVWDDNKKHRVMTSNHDVWNELQRTGCRIMGDDEVAARRRNFAERKAAYEERSKRGG